MTYREHSITKKGALWELYVDGAARNNPGPAGAGLYLVKNGVPVEQHGLYLGLKTNNQAEYLSLLLGLYFAEIHMKPEDRLIIKADSELMVKQISGVYRVRNKELGRIFTMVQSLLSKLDYTIEHIPREKNMIADKLANKGIDKKIAVPQEILMVWPLHEATL